MSKNDSVLYEAEKDGMKLQIFRDPNPPDPRENDNMGTMVCWHDRYLLGDSHGFKTPTDFLIDIINTAQNKENDFENIDAQRVLEMAMEKALIFPLYLYDHGGITISMSSFLGRAHHAEWDSGQVGWVYVLHEKLKKEYSTKRITKSIIARATTCINGEVEEYDLFLRGDGVGYELSKVITCPHCCNITYDVIDSCWGFWGDDFKNNGIAGNIPAEYQHLVDLLERV